jgi:osmotically-inducible protein OsmY
LINEFLLKISDSPAGSDPNLHVSCTFGGGVFYLRGRVSTDENRRALLEIARRIDGVHDVSDLLELCSPK